MHVYMYAHIYIYIYIYRCWFSKALAMRFKVLKSEESLLGDTTKDSSVLP